VDDETKGDQESRLHGEDGNAGDDGVPPTNARRFTGPNRRPLRRDVDVASALTQTEDTGIGASFSKIALAEVVHMKGRQSLLWALM
jgi:hypothetical protein